MTNHAHQRSLGHVPVLLEDVLRYAAPQAGDSYLDLTAGYGGHARAILERTQVPGQAVLVDRDGNAVATLDRELPAAKLIHTDFWQASQQLHAASARFNIILADLGVSSPHLDRAERGFSIAADGPLDMRMDQRQALDAATIINTYPAEQIAGILKRYGEEPKARRIAELIVARREHAPITTTAALAAVASLAWPGHSRVHPATRTFQALRIAVNDELRQVEASLPLWIDLLAPGGRLVVISFHSLEDRLVKQALQEVASDRYDAPLKLLTKRPVTAEATELVTNPRARSAKLRAAVKQI